MVGRRVQITQQFRGRMQTRAQASGPARVLSLNKKEGIPLEKKLRSYGFWEPCGTWGCRVQGADSRLSKRHSEQGIRPPLGEQSHGLCQFLLQLMASRRLWLRPREAVELRISVLEGPVVFHWGAEAQAWQRRGN